MKMRDNNHSQLVKGMEMKCWKGIDRNVVVTPSLEGCFFKNRFGANQLGTVYMYLALHQ